MWEKRHGAGTAGGVKRTAATPRDTIDWSRARKTEHEKFIG